MNGDKRTVLVTSRSFGLGSRDLVRDLEDAGYDVVRAAPSHDPEQLREPLSRATAWIAGTGPITTDHLELAPHLRVIARYGVGTDAVDVGAASQRGVVVTNTPGANSGAVADHALALTLALLRGVVAGDRGVRVGDWSVRQGRELSALVCGVVGFGRIGQAYAARLAALGASVLVFDPFVPDEVVVAAGHEPVGIDELPSRVDVVSLHMPGGQAVITSGFLQRLRPGAVIVNTARADLIDEEAVAAALRSARLAGLAADTLASEQGGASLLLADDLSDRVVVTPHLGAQTVQAVDLMGSTAVADVLAVLADRPPAHPVTTVEENA